MDFPAARACSTRVPAPLTLAGKMELQKPKLLVVDDDGAYLASLGRALRRKFEVLTASEVEGALREFGANPDLVLLDIRLDEGDSNNRAGVELLISFLEANHQIPVVMTSAYGDVDVAVECMRLGAADFIQKSAGAAELQQRLKTALNHAKLSRKVEHLEERLSQIEPSELIGMSHELQQIKQLIHAVGQDGYATVLIRGETGTGKELVARAIHRAGWRSKEPIVPVTVAALNSQLIESDLFGHEEGAFTGAKKRRVGFIEKAKCGVLFLDEIGELPLDAQLKLLRFLEERKFNRVGSSDEIDIDVQIVAATNRNLEKAVADGQFREDLYFRLKSVQIHVPPLRERAADIPLMVKHFLELLREQGRTRIAEVAADVMDSLIRYQWPGNVRELKATIERASIYANYHAHLRIEKDDIPLEVLNASSSSRLPPPGNVSLEDGIILDKELARVELAYIEKALKLTEERKTEAWKFLGLNDRFALLRKVKTIIKEYPSLIDDFPTVNRLYGK